MSVVTKVTRLVEGFDLTPGQVAELRAINSLYYSRLAGNQSASSDCGAELEHLVVGRVRAMLAPDQQILFDHQLAALRLDESRDGASMERHS